MLINRSLRIDLGCGINKADGFIGVDLCPGAGVDIVADLSQRFPFEDSSVEEIRAHDVIEHLPDRIHTMNEIWRVCKPGAKVDIRVPSTDGRGAFQDPTHISFWNINSFLYYCNQYPGYLQLCRRYGFKGEFHAVRLEHEESPGGVIHVIAELTVVKKTSNLSQPPILENTKDDQIKFPQIKPIIYQEPRPFWSVMIPTYNNTQFLEKTLRSVLEQAVEPEEMQIEVVDDCSTEVDIEAIVKKIGQGRISFYRQPKNLGFVANWNFCIERARGHWVHILHQDDFVMPGFYHKLEVSIKSKTDIGAAFCRFLYIDEEEKETAISPLERETSGILENWLELIGISNRIECPSIVVKRSIYEQLGGFCIEAAYAADWEMWKRIAVHYKFWYESEILAAYRRHSLAATSPYIISGENIAYTRRAIEISELYLPKDMAANISNQARENYAIYALHLAQKMLEYNQLYIAVNQIREGLQCSNSSSVKHSLVNLLNGSKDLMTILTQFLLLTPTEEIIKYSNNYQTIHINSTYTYKQVNIIVFPNWQAAEELLYEELMLLFKNFLLIPEKDTVKLFIVYTDISEEDANFIISDVVFTLMQQEDIEDAETADVEFIGNLNEKEWQSLMSNISARVQLNIEDQFMIKQVQADKLKTLQIENINNTINHL
jgi:glycosyltransferase involved in cell wall biosynthesis